MWTRWKNLRVIINCFIFFLNKKKGWIIRGRHVLSNKSSRTFVSRMCQILYKKHSNKWMRTMWYFNKYSFRTIWISFILCFLLCSIYQVFLKLISLEFFFFFIFRLNLRSLNRKKSNNAGGISSAYLKQLINFLQILNIINFIDFTQNEVETKANFLSDFLSGSFSRFFSLECFFSRK
jgi:hypothetical protein